MWGGFPRFLSVWLISFAVVSTTWSTERLSWLIRSSMSVHSSALLEVPEGRGEEGGDPEEPLEEFFIGHSNPRVLALKYQGSQPRSLHNW